MSKVAKVVVYVFGGNVQGVYTDHPENVQVEVVDADNLEAEGKTEKQIDSTVDEARAGLTCIY